MATAFTEMAIQVANGNLFEHALQSFPEKASETFKKGAILELESGYATEWDGTGQILGVAMEAGHNGGSDGTYSVLVAPAYGPFEFYGSLENALAVTDLGANYGLKKNTHWVVDADASGHVHVVELTGMKPNPFHTEGVALDTGVVCKFIFDRSAAFGA